MRDHVTYAVSDFYCFCVHEQFGQHSIISLNHSLTHPMIQSHRGVVMDTDIGISLHTSASSCHGFSVKKNSIVIVCPILNDINVKILISRVYGFPSFLRPSPGKWSSTVKCFWRCNPTFASLCTSKTPIKVLVFAPKGYRLILYAQIGLVRSVRDTHHFLRRLKSKSWILHTISVIFVQVWCPYKIQNVPLLELVSGLYHCQFQNIYKHIRHKMRIAQYI